MEIKPAYHVAFLVANMDAATARFEKSLGVRFRPAEPLSPTGPRSTYSYEGPPYVQLIEAAPDGVYGIQQGEGFHHLGVWVDDADECLTAMAADGIQAENRFTRGDVTSAWYSGPAALHGVRVEYTGEVVRNGVEAWLRGEQSLGDAAS